MEEILKQSEEEYIQQQIMAIEALNIPDIPDNSNVKNTDNVKKDKHGYIADVELYRYGNFKKIRHMAGSKLVLCVLIFTTPEFHDHFMYLIERLRVMADKKYTELLLHIELVLNSKHTIETIMAQDLAYDIIKFTKLIIRYLCFNNDLSNTWEYISYIFNVQIIIHGGPVEKYCACALPVANINLLRIKDEYAILVVDGTKKQQMEMFIKKSLTELEECKLPEYVADSIKEFIHGRVLLKDIEWVYREQLPDKAIKLIQNCIEKN